MTEPFRDFAVDTATGAGDARSMSLFERFRRFWGSDPGGRPDHPLTEEERAETHEQTAYDELAADAARYVDGFDPDDDRRE